MTAEQFFPPRAEREVLDFVLEDFPFPLALTYARLQDALDLQEPVAAAWQLRDAYECLLKFSACLAVADLLHAKPNHEAAGEIVGLLLKPSGLGMGDWHSLLVKSLNPREGLVVDDALFRSGRVLPELLGVFFDFEPSGLLKANALNRDIDGRPDSADDTPNSFVRWRNVRFGHGVFRVDRTVYVEETLRWLDALHRFYKALRPVLDARQLVSVAPGGEELVWRGTQHLLSPPPHEHEPSGDPVPMSLAPRPGEAGASLPLSPFLSVQPCDWCGQPTAFFFDKYKLVNKNKKSHKTFCLEYFGGHLYPRDDWDQVGKLTDRLPEKFKPKRASYPQREVAEGLEVVFRDFEEEYVPPDYLFDAFWRALSEKQRGYIHLVGEGGTGKTYFVRGLEAEGTPDTPVLSYHVLPGARTDYTTFIPELADRARERLNFRTQEPQTNVDSHEKLQDQLVEFLGELMHANGCDKLIVALDAIDELPDPEPNAAAITDFLPSPEKLPRGCFVLLTSRKNLRPKIQEDLDLRIRGGDGRLYTPITLSPQDPNNRRLVAAYVAPYFERLIRQGQLAEVYRSAEYVEAVLERSGGIFLYARHLAGALASGAFTTGALPEAHEFYPTYLDRLRNRVGEELYDTVYLRTLLLLSAAQEPVTLEQLHQWGVPPEGLRLALYDIADFMREHRGRLWHDSLAEGGENRYELAHEAFLRYVREDLELYAQYRAAHAEIARTALAEHADDRWTGADPTEESDLYDLRHTLTHLHEAGDTRAEEALLADEGYASACWLAGKLADKRARYWIAVDLYDRAVRVFRHLVKVKGREELADDLAMALSNRGVALWEQGRLDEAVRDLGEAVEIYRHLVELRWCAELADKLAAVLSNRGVALWEQSELNEAVGDLGEAIGILRPLVEVEEVEEHEQQLSDDLAMALTDRGLVLMKQGKLDEAAGDLDEAVSIRRRLVQVEGLERLAASLAAALTNRGLVLRKQGRLDEGVRDLGEAVGIYKRLVEVEGHDEQLADKLAAVLTNRGSARLEQGELDEAIGDFDEAIGILRPLVKVKGRAELADNLEKPLTNRGIALNKQGKLDEAVGDFNEAIHWLESCIRAGMWHLTPQLLRTIRYRMMTLLDLKRWDEVATDITHILNYDLPFLQEDTVPEAVMEELRALVRVLRELAPQDRERAYEGLDERIEEVVWGWVEGP